MADVTQFTIEHRELIELVIKKADIHEGQWSLLVNFGIGTGMFGPTPEQTNFGLMISFNQFGIQKVPTDAPQAHGVVVVDAAKVNPKD
jgi:hypothetical protein